MTNVSRVWSMCVLYANGRAYTAPSLDGPWKDYNLEYDTRGTPSGEMTNHTFTPREDGSLLMVSRGGRVWINCQETINQQTLACNDQAAYHNSDNHHGNEDSIELTLDRHGRKRNGQCGSRGTRDVA